MKNNHPISSAIKVCCLSLAALILFSFQDVIAQDIKYKSKDLQVTKQKTNGFDEATLRQKMKADGLSDPIIDKLIADRKVWMKQGKNISWTNVKNSGNPPVVQAPCGDMGGENGWGQWLSQVGTTNSGAPPTWTPPPALPTAPNYIGR